MSIELKFDKDGFSRVMREHIEKVAADTGDQFQEALDTVHAEYPGPDAPIDHVRTAPVSALAQTDLTLTEPELTSYAEKLAAGYRILIRTQIVE